MGVEKNTKNTKSWLNLSHLSNNIHHIVRQSWVTYSILYGNNLSNKQNLIKAALIHSFIWINVLITDDV